MASEQEDKLLEQHLRERDTLVDALKSYADCRHGEISCRCTSEARVALFPYLRRERFLADAMSPKV